MVLIHRYQLIFAYLCFSLLILPKAFGACTTPSGIAGTFRYDTGLAKFFYCNDTSWVDMSGGSAGVTSVTASPPLASSGGSTPVISIGQGNGITNSAGSLLLNVGNGLQFNTGGVRVRAPSGSGLTRTAAGIGLDVGASDWQSRLNSSIPNCAANQKLNFLSGTYSCVADDAVKLQGRTVSSEAPRNGSLLTWATSQWVPRVPGPPTVVTRSSNFSVATSEENHLYLVDSSLIATLPPLASVPEGFRVNLKKVASSYVQVKANGAELIDGVNTRAIVGGASGFLQLIATSGGWAITSGSSESVSGSCTPGSQTFSSTGADSLVISGTDATNCTYVLTVKGGPGGRANGGAAGAVRLVFKAPSAGTFSVFVGGIGSNTGAGGVGGGGNGGGSSVGGGGGASAVAFESNVLVLAGGGGGGSEYTAGGAGAGIGGGGTVHYDTNLLGGSGGNSNVGGAGGTCAQNGGSGGSSSGSGTTGANSGGSGGLSNATFLISGGGGGANNSYDGGGGGGGYGGGGGGCAGGTFSWSTGGGGGGGYVNTSNTGLVEFSPLPGHTGSDGSIVIEWR